MKMFRLVSAFVLAIVLASFACRPVVADGMTYQRHYRAHVLPDRHVVEVVQPPYSGNFIINATRFVGKTPACLRWVAGDRIRLIAGDWHGECVEAVFYNYARHSTCVASCGGGGWWRWRWW